MMDPNGNQLPYPTISYANGPGFNDHFDNVRIAIFVSRADKILFYQVTGFWKNISEMNTQVREYHIFELYCRG